MALSGKSGKMTYIGEVECMIGDEENITSNKQ